MLPDQLNRMLRLANGALRKIAERERIPEGADVHHDEATRQYSWWLGYRQAVEEMIELARQSGS